MPNWYRAYSCLGNSATLAAQVAIAVEKMNLGKCIRSLRVEKRAKGNFYMFLEFDTKIRGELSTEIESQLKSVPCLKLPQPGVFEFEQIKTMVGAELEVHEYARRLNFWKTTEPPPEDPFANPEDEWLGYDSTQLDNLLLWLSHHGSVSWPRFVGAVAEIVTSRGGGTPRQVARRLKLLGHVEVSAEGRCISIAPSTLNEIAPNIWLFAGQRDKTTFENLSQFGQVTELGLQCGPSRITVLRDKAEGPADLSVLRSQGITVQNGVSERLSELLPDLRAWARGLPALEGLKTSLYDLRVFDGQAFSEGVFSSTRSGFYELWPPNGAQGKKRPDYTAFFDAESGSWRRGDWYGLRFLALSQVSKCQAKYNPSTALLAVPIAWRWPEIYERCLVLSGGMLPETKAGWLVYSAVNPNVVKNLGAKLLIEILEEM